MQPGSRIGNHKSPLYGRMGDVVLGFQRRDTLRHRLREPAGRARRPRAKSLISISTRLSYLACLGTGPLGREDRVARGVRMHANVIFHQADAAGVGIDLIDQVAQLLDVVGGSAVVDEADMPPALRRGRPTRTDWPCHSTFRRSHDIRAAPAPPVAAARDFLRKVTNFSSRQTSGQEGSSDWAFRSRMSSIRKTYSGLSPRVCHYRCQGLSRIFLS